MSRPKSSYPSAVPLRKRLLFVLGKGGVGRTTVAGALGLAAARAGRRTIVCEVAGQEGVARALERDAPGYSEAPLAPGLWGMSVDSARATQEYLRDQLGSATLGRMLSDNRLFGLLAAATPGLRELVTVGKLWELAQLERRSSDSRGYDLVVVDAPATGHGLALLRAPRTFAAAAVAGPISRQAGLIDAFLHDRESTGVVAVTAPEQTPVTEALELVAELETEGMRPDRLVVNGLLPARLDTEEAAVVAGQANGGVSPGEAALRVALAEHVRSLAQREQVERLRAGVTGRVVSLPFLFAPELGAPEMEELAEELARAL